MISEAEYKEKLARAEELSALDPETNSPEAVKLLSLVEELQEYERAHFPEMFRPAGRCDGCGRDMPPGFLEPWEAGDWYCRDCVREEYREALERKEKRDANPKVDG